MEKFAKLYEVEGIGQILVKIDTADDECPEVRFYVMPDGLGVSTKSFVWPNTDEGWETAEAYFDDITEESAIEEISHFLVLSKEIVTNGID